MITEVTVKLVAETQDAVKYACHALSKDGTKTQLREFMFHKPFTNSDVGSNIWQRLMELDG